MKLHRLHFLTLALFLGVGSLMAADETNSTSSLDPSSFDIISRRNIFDPTRTGRSPRTDRPAPVRVDSITLVGVMSSEKGSFAFFDSNNSSYRKTLKPADTIAGYTIIEITPNSIKLSAASNQVINLTVGNQMRRRDGGPWSLRSRAQSGDTETTSIPGAPPELSARAATLNGAEGDALKRLMLKRMQEK